MMKLKKKKMIVRIGSAALAGLFVIVPFSVNSFVSASAEGSNYYDGFQYSGEWDGALPEAYRNPLAGCYIGFNTGLDYKNSMTTWSLPVSFSYSDSYSMSYPYSEVNSNLCSLSYGGPSLRCDYRVDYGSGSVYGLRNDLCWTLRGENFFCFYDDFCECLKASFISTTVGVDYEFVLSVRDLTNYTGDHFYRGIGPVELDILDKERVSNFTLDGNGAFSLDGLSNYAKNGIIYVANFAVNLYFTDMHEYSMDDGYITLTFSDIFGDFSSTLEFDEAMYVALSDWSYREVAIGESPMTALTSSVESFLNMELFPGFHFYYLLYIAIGFILFGFILKFALR